MTLIRGFGTPLLSSALPAPGLNGGDISFIIIAAFYYTDLFHRAKKEGRKEEREEGNIAFGTEISSVAFVKIAQALRLCHRFNFTPLQDGVSNSALGEYHATTESEIPDRRRP